MMMNSKLSPNVIEEIYKYADKKLKEDAPKFIVKVKQIERDKLRYCAVLLDGSEKEILAIFSPLLTEKIPIQDLIVDSVIKINHYYLYKFRAEDFSINPPKTDIDVMGICDIEILRSKELKKMEMEKHIGIAKTSKKVERSRKEQQLLMTLLERESESQVNDTKEAKNTVNQLDNKKPQQNPKPKPQKPKPEVRKEDVRPLENKNQKQDQKSRLKIESTEIKTDSRPLEVKNQQQNHQPSNGVRSKVDITKNPIPIEKKQQNIVSNSTYSSPASFAGNGRPASQISSLVLTKNSPLIRGYLTSVGEKFSDKKCGFTWCNIQDLSGTMKCIIFEPYFSRIYHLLEVGVMMEVQNGRIQKDNIGDQRLVISRSSDIAIYHKTTCVFQTRLNIVLPNVSSTNTSSRRYPQILNIKQTLDTNQRVDAIGILKNKSELNNKCRNITIEDETGSAIVVLQDNAAERFNNIIGSILVVQAAWPKMLGTVLQLIVDNNSKVLLADNCDDKIRLEKWYQRSKNKRLMSVFN